MYGIQICRGQDLGMTLWHNQNISKYTECCESTSESWSIDSHYKWCYNFQRLIFPKQLIIISQSQLLMKGIMKILCDLKSPFPTSYLRRRHKRPSPCTVARIQNYFFFFLMRNGKKALLVLKHLMDLNNQKLLSGSFLAKPDRHANTCGTDRFLVQLKEI